MKPPLLDARAEGAKPLQLRDRVDNRFSRMIRRFGLENFDPVDFVRPVRLDRRFCGGVFFHEATVPCGPAKGPSRKTPENFFADRERVFAA